MKTKFLAMILAVLMLLVSFAGCGKERTAEEYLRESFKVDLEKAANPYDFDSVKYSIGVGNIESLLKLLQVDTAELPSIKDVSIDMYGDVTGKNTGVISATVNDYECDIKYGLDIEDFKLTLASNLLSKSYAIPFGELYKSMGITMPTFDAEYQKALTESAVKHVEHIVEHIIANSTLTKADGEDGKVVVTADFTAEQFAALAIAILDCIKTDDVLSEYLDAIVGAYDISMEEIWAEYEAGKADFSTAVVDAGAAIKLAITIDKKTCVAEKADVDVTADGETVKISAVDTDERIAAMLSGPGFEGGFALDFTKDGVNGSLDITVDGNTAEADLVCADGKADLTAKLIQDAEGDALENTVKLSGEYNLGENTFEFLVTEVGFNEITLDLREAAITVGAVTDCEIPELPVADEEITDFSENGPLMAVVQELMMTFMLKTGMFSMN